LKGKQELRLDFGEVFLELAIVLGSLSILTKRPEMWYLSMGSAGVGIVLAVSTYWVS
jgi:hypothetical protein